MASQAGRDNCQGKVVTRGGGGVFKIKYGNSTHLSGFYGSKRWHATVAKSDIVP